MLLFSLLAQANEPDLSGTWTLGVERSTARARQRQAMEQALEAIPALVRGLARRKIRQHLRTCRAMAIQLGAERFEAACMGGPTVVVDRPGPGTWKDEAGVTYRTTLDVREDAVVMDVRGDDGGQRTLYRLEENGLTTVTTLSAPRLPEPITWTVPYVRAE